jgi:MFS family permease
VTAHRRPSALAPFTVRSFRFQWPADLLTSWAFEMETLILGWYVLVETGSVLLLTVFGALQFFGTLISPLLGVAGDRRGHRNVLCAMRAWYLVLAAILMGLAFAGLLDPYVVLVISALAGLIRPSDHAMRHAIVAETMPPALLVGGMGISRTTSDSARIAGALAGAGLFAWLGMGPAYIVVTVFYVLGLLLTFGVVGSRRGPKKADAGTLASARTSAWRDLREGLVYVWTTPRLLAAMWIAFLVNLTAFPLSNGLLPFVAREVYRIDQTGLGYLAASFAGGALVGSLSLSIFGGSVRPGRAIIVATLAWYLLLLGFAQMTGLAGGTAMLFLAGAAQSLSMVPMAVMLLRTSSEELRGRVMGVRMLAIYSLPLGLLAAGWLIGTIGFQATATLYALIGLACTALIAIGWRREFWTAGAPANAR